MYRPRNYSFRPPQVQQTSSISFELARPKLEQMDTYKAEYFVDPEDVKKFCCIICKNLVPFEKDCTLHICCDGCICISCYRKILDDPNAKCPKCNMLFAKLMFPITSLNKKVSLIRKIKVKCSVPKCSWVGPFDEVIAHMEKCDFQEIDCPRKCGQKFLFKDKMEHLKNKCELRKIRCEFCNERIPFKSTEEHKAGCNQRPVICALCGQRNKAFMDDAHKGRCEKNPKWKCKFEYLGCKFEDTKEKVLEHEKNEDFVHLELAEAKLKEKNISSENFIIHQDLPLHLLPNHPPFTYASPPPPFPINPFEDEKFPYQPRPYSPDVYAFPSMRPRGLHDSLFDSRPPRMPYSDMYYPTYGFSEEPRNESLYRPRPRPRPYENYPSFPNEMGPYPINYLPRYAPNGSIRFPHSTYREPQRPSPEILGFRQMPAIRMQFPPNEIMPDSSIGNIVKRISDQIMQIICEKGVDMGDKYEKANEIIRELELYNLSDEEIDRLDNDTEYLKSKVEPLITRKINEKK